MIQILNGLKYMHDQDLIHRDVKPGNLLMNKHGQVKFADFGLARSISDIEGKALTRNVVTRFYRPPEILYGASKYDKSIDIWGVGCILGELVHRDFMFRADGEIDQLNKIFSLLGNATEDVWPGVTELPNYLEFECD